MVAVDETRQPSSLVLIGHVDAGKSTISGNIMFSTGVVDQRTIEKYKQEARKRIESLGGLPMLWMIAKRKRKRVRPSK